MGVVSAVNKAGRFCTSCGTALPDGTKFCAECGMATISDDASRRYSKVESGVRNAPMAIFVAILMGVPAALLLSLILGLIAGGGSLGGAITKWTLLYGLFAFPFMFTGDDLRPRTSFRNGLITVSLESFFSPLVALIFTGVVGSNAITHGASNAAVTGVAIGTGLVGFVLVTIGIGIAIAVGVPCLVLYFVLKSPSGKAELLA